MSSMRANAVERTKMATTEEMRKSVFAYFDAVACGDRARLFELFAADIRWRVPEGAVAPYAGLHEGAGPVVDLMLTAVEGAFVPGSQETEILSFVFGDDVTIVESELRAHTPDDRLYLNRYAFFFEFRDGFIAEIREYVDTRYAANFFAGDSE